NKGCIDGRSVCVEGAVGVGDVQVVFLDCIGDDIDCSSKRIGTQSDGDHSLVNFYAFRNINGNIIQLEGRSKIIHWNPIDKKFHLLTGESVKGKGMSEAYPAAFADTNA